MYLMYYRFMIQNRFGHAFATIDQARVTANGYALVDFSAVCITSDQISAPYPSAGENRLKSNVSSVTNLISGGENNHNFKY